MGEADITTKEYVQMPEIFADAFNFVLGEHVLDAAQLSELSETERVIPYVFGKKSRAIEKMRDVFKKNDTES